MMLDYDPSGLGVTCYADSRWTLSIVGEMSPRQGLEVTCDFLTTGDAHRYDD